MSLRQLPSRLLPHSPRLSSPLARSFPRPPPSSSPLLRRPLSSTPFRSSASLLQTSSGSSPSTSTPILTTTDTSSSPASSSSAPPPSSVVTPPTAAALAQLAEEGMDVELVPLDLATLKVTPSAWKQLTKIALREKDEGLRFRIAVESGGCHGYQYKMDLTNEVEGDDYTFSPTPDKPASTPIVIDSSSLALLKGATVDFATELIGSSFRIAENPQAKGSGCGCGVSWEAI